MEPTQSPIQSHRHSSWSQAGTLANHTSVVTPMLNMPLPHQRGANTQSWLGLSQGGDGGLTARAEAGDGTGNGGLGMSLWVCCRPLLDTAQ